MKCHGLNSIPASIPSQATEIDLSSNRINSIWFKDFQGCINLVQLDISYNQITYIQPDTFKPLRNLRILRMYHTLKYPMNISFDTLFIGLTNLEHIDMQYNFFKYVFFSMDMFSMILGQFPVTLKSLFIDIPDNSTFAVCFQRFKHLNNLGITSQDGVKLYITNSTFEPLTNSSIQKLSLQANSLTKVEALAFSWFSELESLDLSNSSGLDFNQIGDAWFGLRYTKLKSLNLKNFGQKAHPVNINLRFFRYFYFERLTELILDYTNIEGADSWNFLKGASNLRYLSITNNKLNSSQLAKLTTSIQSLQHLSNLDLKRQLPRKINNFNNNQNDDNFATESGIFRPIRNFCLAFLSSSCTQPMFSEQEQAEIIVFRKQLCGRHWYSLYRKSKY